MTNRILRVLYVEDSERDANLLTRHLTGAGYELTSERVETRAAMRSALEAQDWDVILCDHSMPHFDAFAALALLQEMVRDIPFVVISIAGETAVEAMRLGAHDYLLKDNLVRLVPIIEREMHESANRRARRKAEAELRHSEAQYRRLIDTAYEGIWITDAEARITYANQRLAEMLGFAVEDIDSIVDELEKRALKVERFPSLPHDERGVCQTPDGTRVVWFRDPDGNLLSVVQYA